METNDGPDVFSAPTTTKKRQEMPHKRLRLFVKAARCLTECGESYVLAQEKEPYRDKVQIRSRSARLNGTEPPIPFYGGLSRQFAIAQPTHPLYQKSHLATQGMAKVNLKENVAETIKTANGAASLGDVAQPTRRGTRKRFIVSWRE